MVVIEFNWGVRPNRSVYAIYCAYSLDTDGRILSYSLRRGRFLPHDIEEWLGDYID